jgi:hypothetical protein
MRTLRLLGMLTLLTGCGGIGGAPDCSAWRPILVHDDDRLTAETARVILAHNLTGRRVCGW